MDASENEKSLLELYDMLDLQNENDLSVNDRIDNGQTRNVQSDILMHWHTDMHSYWYVDECISWWFFWMPRDKRRREK